MMGFRERLNTSYALSRQMAEKNLGDEGSTEKLKLIHDHAWNWFAHHAEQRMTALRFFLLVIGIFAVGYYQTLNNGHYLLAAAFSLLSCCFSVLFWRLDIRTRELIRVGEDILSQTEIEMTKLSTIQVAIISDVDGKSSKHATKLLPKLLYSYGQIFSAIFLLSFFFSACTATFALSKGGIFRAIAQKICAI
jgi:hypothetical protein